MCIYKIFSCGKQALLPTGFFLFGAECFYITYNSVPTSILKSELILFYYLHM
uniref:Uncharacterized protein n=1 Tax=Rhizophora mucronata TaxID=61149 RepID=A0A2P2N4I2_RHIMU